MSNSIENVSTQENGDPQRRKKILRMIAVFTPIIVLFFVILNQND